MCVHYICVYVYMLLTDLFVIDVSKVTLTFSGLKLTNGTSVWGSVAMAHSSMRICRALSVLVRLGEAAAVQVHRIISCFSSSYKRAEFSSFLYLRKHNLVSCRHAFTYNHTLIDTLLDAEMCFRQI